MVDGTIFWSLRQAREIAFDPGHPSYKAAISVRAGARLTLKVAARDRDWLSLDYDRTVNDPPGVPVTHFVPCAPDTPRFSDDGVVGARPLGRRVRRRAGGMRDAAPAPRGPARSGGTCGWASGRPVAPA